MLLRGMDEEAPHGVASSHRAQRSAIDQAIDDQRPLHVHAHYGQDESDLILLLLRGTLERERFVDSACECNRGLRDPSGRRTCGCCQLGRRYQSASPCPRCQQLRNPMAMALGHRVHDALSPGAQMCRELPLWKAHQQGPVVRLGAWARAAQGLASIAGTIVKTTGGLPNLPLCRSVLDGEPSDGQWPNHAAPAFGHGANGKRRETRRAR
mmetsp:Transcript_102587/g.260585  ORF Transcript_102587/g.260585 Transcript_102587/m.260585 type:complete len:210 (+) Transcript_102587:735-1364(+)